MVVSIVVASLATLVAIQYGFIGIYVVPRLAQLADDPGGAIAAARWGAAAFFLGCAVTHVGIAAHALLEPALNGTHVLAVHVWPHLAQIAGGATFSYVAWRKIDVRFSPKGEEARRERAERERQRAAALLAEQAAGQAAVAGLGQLALQTTEPLELIREAVRVVARTLKVDHCKVLELLPGGDSLRVIAGVGWRPGVVGHAVVATEGGSQAGFTLHSGKAVVVEDLRCERRFEGHALLHEHGIVSGATIVINTRAGPFGVLGVHTTARRTFARHDIDFLTSVANVLATAIDRAGAEEENRRRALHDGLTGLPNRTLFRDRLEHALARSARHPANTGVLVLDVDDFKAVNDTSGHSAGDELLVSVAARLQGSLRSADTLARFGGDEFAVLCESLDGEHEAAEIAERISAALAQPFTLDGNNHFVTASVGIAVAESPDARAETLLRDADVAMYRAKERGRGRYEMFDEQLRQRTLERLQLENALRGAVERGELRLAYQPLVSLTDGAIEGAEALLRWEHQEWGPVSPAAFIPVAEQSGLILPLGTWVLQEACRQAAGWRDACQPPLKVSVNVSAHQLAQPDFVDTVTAALEQAGAEPRQLALELTETVLMQAAPSTLDTLARLRQLGVDIVLDDFGTGYSSLGYLERFPLDGLKIDRAFVAGLADNPTSQAIFAAIITMASALHLPVVAEGIETEEQANRVRSLGCRSAQGYHFARPMPPSQLGQLLSERPPPAAAAGCPGPPRAGWAPQQPPAFPA